MFKTFKSSILIIVLLLLSYFCITDEKVINAVAEDKYIGEVQLGGDTIGIKINTNVEIVGKYEINVNNQKVKPWINSNIEEGDFIYSIDDKIITCNNDLNNIISQSNKETLNLKLIRNNQLIYTTINVFKNANDNNSIGLYVKDHITGIGTLTFVNLNTNKFGALGHSVSEALNEGQLYDSSIKGVKKAVKGIPGEKYATLSNNNIGSINMNTDIGIFGEYKKTSTNEIVNVVKNEYINKGEAEIVTVINGNIIKKYDIIITEVNKQKEVGIKGIKFKVVDEELINATGGIIQGMSGSPIIQDGNLIGAVSHVVVKDPLCGYGVFAEWMYYQTL